MEASSPSEVQKLDLLIAGPSCTFHSLARNGKPTSDQERMDPWYLMPWIEHHRPSFLIIENVPEFKKWGPVGEDGKPLKKFAGKFFDAWIMAIQAAGYKVDFRVLCAADYGAVTSRRRLFIIAKKGNRAPAWPDPTHTRSPGNELPGMSLPRWRSAFEIIDWSIPVPSIFNRKIELRDKTLLRLDAGVRRFVGPFVAKFRGNPGTHPCSESLCEPLSTVTAQGKHHGICIPFGLQVCHGLDGHKNARTFQLDKPIHTITTSNGMRFALPFQYQLIGKGAGRSKDIAVPIPTMIASRNQHGFCVPWIPHYYGTTNQSPVTDPLDTVTTKERHSLAIAICGGPDDWLAATTEAMTKLQATMREHHVADLLFRMFVNRELAAATGFPPDYVFHGNSKEITKQIGNAVPPAFTHHIYLGLAG